MKKKKNSLKLFVTWFIVEMSGLSGSLSYTSEMDMIHYNYDHVLIGLLMINEN